MIYKLLLKLQGLILVGVLTACYIVAWVFFLVNGLASTLSAIMAAIVVAVATWYLLGARNNARKYWDIKGWAWLVRIDRGQDKIPAKAFDRIRYVLDEVKDDNGKVVFREERIRRAWREHLFSTVPAVWWAVLLAIICLILCVQAMLVSPDPAFPWWVFGLLAMIFIGTAEVRSWPWKYRYYAVTDIRIVRVTAAPPLIAPFLSGKAKSVELRRIITADQNASSMGDMAGYGTVGLDTDANLGDVEFNSIPFTPEYVEVAKIINTARLYAQHLAAAGIRMDEEVGAPFRPRPSRPSNAVRRSKPQLSSLKRQMKRRGARS